MPRNRASVVTLGELVAAAYDCASETTPNARAAAELTARTVAHLLARHGRGDLAWRLAGAAPTVQGVRVEQPQRQAA